MKIISYKKGISIVETVVAIAIFTLLVSAGYQAYVGANRLAARADKKAIALSIAEEGIEAARSIRDQDFSLLTAGTKGLSLSSGSWQFSGTSDTSNGYVRRIIVSSSSTDAYTVRSDVSWNDRGATSTVSLNTQLTNWRKTVGMATGFTVNSSAVTLSSADSLRLLDDITLNTDGSVSTTTVSSVQVSWSNVPTTRRLQQVRSPNGTVIWTGTSASGANNVLTSPIVMAGAASRSFQLRFNASMSGANITIVYTFSDGSTKTVVINNPPSGA